MIKIDLYTLYLIILLTIKLFFNRQIIKIIIKVNKLSIFELQIGTSKIIYIQKSNLIYKYVRNISIKTFSKLKKCI